MATAAPVPLTNANNAEEVFRSLRSQSESVRSLCIACQAASVASNVLASLLQQSVNFNTFLVTLSGNATLQAALNVYMQTITGQTTHNFLPDITALQAATNTLILAIVADYPKDASNHPLDRVMDGSGNVTSVSFTQAQLVQTAPAITAWLTNVN